MRDKKENNKPQVLYVLKGLPASGKSTWAKKKAKEEPNTVIVSRDNIREMLKGEYNLFPFGSKMEEIITDIENTSILYVLAKGYDVIIDATNFRLPNHWTHQLSEQFRCKVEIVDFTHVDIKTCIQRDQQREFPVGKEVIQRQFDKYLKDK